LVENTRILELNILETKTSKFSKKKQVFEPLLNHIVY
jgi:hypothetical protein